MKIIADKTRCAGHARCAAVADQLFELDSNGYIAFQQKIVPAGAEELARRGVFTLRAPRSRNSIARA